MELTLTCSFLIARLAQESRYPPLEGRMNESYPFWELRNAVIAHLAIKDRLGAINFQHKVCGEISSGPSAHDEA
jgi:hypothetical protein